MFDSEVQPHNKIASNFKRPFLERHGLKSASKSPPYRTAEEEKAEALRLKKIERAKKKEVQEKERVKHEKKLQFRSKPSLSKWS